MRRAWLRADLVAGLAAGAVVIPQAMAYATVAGMPVQVGIYTCLVPMLIYFLLGGSRTLSVSTTSTIATLSASTLLAAGVAGGSIPDLETLTFLVGVILLAARLLRLANLIRNVSDAVLLGLKTGVGLTVAVGQLPKVLGLPGSGSGHFFSQLHYALVHLDQASATTLALSAVSIAVLLLFRRLWPSVPGPLVVVAGGIVLVAWAHVDQHGIALISHIPQGLPRPTWPAFDRVGGLLPGAVAIALMAFLETVSVAKGVRRRGEPWIESDRELLTVGVAATATSFFQSLPPAGGFSQTATNIASGARSQLSQLSTLVLAVLTALFLGPVLSDLPQATLGSLVVVATLSLISLPALHELERFSRPEFVVASVTAALGLVSGLLVAVGAGVVLTLGLVLHELNSAPVIEVAVERQQITAGTAGADGTGGAADAVPAAGLLILRVGVPLYTANVHAVAERVLAAVRAAARPIAVVVLDVTSVGMLSTTILAAERELEAELADLGTTLWIASLPQRALDMARRSAEADRWRGQHRVWSSVPDAVRAFERTGGQSSAASNS
ncbi:MAG: sulfate transporter [Frankiales bacterium]|nr:sulfate transporter [Frankiales bacterium]